MKASVVRLRILLIHGFVTAVITSAICALSLFVYSSRHATHLVIEAPAPDIVVVERARDPVASTEERVSVDTTPEPSEPPPIDRPQPEISEFGPGSCPPPSGRRDRNAGTPLAEAGELTGYHEDYGALHGVATSHTRHGVIAGWTDTAIYVSVDDGRTFRRVLDGPGQVASVAVDCRGRVFALRGRDQLGVRSGTDERWHVLAFASAPEPWTRDASGPVPMIAVGGGYIAVMDSKPYSSLLGVSSDGGATWRYRHIDAHSEPITQLRVTPRGDVRLLTTWFDCMAGGQSAYLGPAGGDLDHRGVPELEQGSWLTSDRWQYTASVSCHDDGARLCVLSPTGDAWRPSQFAIDDGDELSVADNGRISLGVIGDKVIRLRRGAIKVVSDDVPDGFAPHSVDSSKRLLGLVGGHLVRWSPRRGWRVLWGPALELGQ